MHVRFCVQGYYRTGSFQLYGCFPFCIILHGATTRVFDKARPIILHVVRFPIVFTCVRVTTLFYLLDHAVLRLFLRCTCTIA